MNQSSDIEALESEFVINTKSQRRSRLVSVVSVGLAVSGVALLVSTTSGKAVTVQNEATSALNVMDRRVTRSGDFERNLAASPTKSPSSGVHKPTWKPSTKPVEHASKSNVGAALPKHRELGFRSSGSTDGTVSNAKTAITASMPVGGAGPITPEGAPTGPQAPILAATPVAMAMTAPFTLYVPEAVDGAKTATLPAAMNLPPTPDAPEKMEVAVAESVVTEEIVDAPIPKISSPNARGDPRNSPTVTSLRTTGGSVSIKKDKESKKETESSKKVKETKPDSSSKSDLKSELKTELKTMKSELKSAKAVVEKGEDALPEASSKKEKKEIKAEIKDAIETVVSKKVEIDQVKETLSDTDADVTVVDGEDVIKEVVTKTVYSQDADYFKKEEKRASRKAYKKAMERANAALEAKKEDVSGAEPDADVSTSTKSNKKKVKSSTTSKETEEEEEEITTKSKSSKSDSKKSSSSSEKSSTKKSSKDVRRHLTKADPADPCHDGLSPRCTPPTSKPVEHRSLAGSPTKSPSSGLHKPTWKPSSKPAEHRRLETREERAEQHDTHVAKDGEDIVTYDLAPSSSTGKSSKDILTPPVKGSKLGQVTEEKDSKKSSKTVSKESSSSNKIAKQIKTTDAAVKDLKKMLPIESKDEKLAFKGEIKEVKADIKDAKKSLAKLDTKDEKKDAKKEIKSEVKTLEEIKLAYDAEVHIPESGKKFLTSHDKDGEDGVDLDTEFLAMEENRTDRKVAKKAKAEAEESLASARPSKDSRKLAVSPTKSPSSGIHKPTWKPSSKPVEHSTKSSVGAALPRRQLSKADKEAANNAKHGNDKFSKKESKKIIEKLADHLDDLKSVLKKASLSNNKDKVSRSLKSLKNKKEELKVFQSAALAAEDTESTYNSESDADVQSFSDKFSSSSTSNKSEREIKKADAKLKAKVADEESKKASKGEIKQENEKALTLKSIERKGDLKSVELKFDAKEAAKSGVETESDFELNPVTGEQKKMTKWLAEAYESSGHRKLSNNKSSIKISVLPKTGADPTKSPSSGIHKPTWRPSSKPIEHKKGDSEPSKSPSSGVHKPTWRPSAKPNEHSSKTSKRGDVGAALPRQL